MAKSIKAETANWVEQYAKQHPERVITTYGTQAFTPTPVVAAPTDGRRKLVGVGRTVEHLIAELCELIASHERDCWLIGDTILRLQELGLKNTAIAKHTKGKWSTERIRQYANTAKLFPPEHRVEGVEWATYEAAWRAEASTPERLRKTGSEIAAAIRNGNRTSRDITKWVKDQREQRFAEERATAAPEIENTLVGVRDNLFCGKWEDLVSRIPDESIDVVWADPPFGAYAGRDTPNLAGALIMTHCANSSYRDYIPTTLNLFKLLAPKITAKGVLFLHQHGGAVDNPLIIRRARMRGWYWHTPLLWYFAPSLDKGGGAAPSTRGNAYGSVCQRILVASRSNQPPEMMRSGLNNANVFPMLPTSRFGALDVKNGRASYFDHHSMQHPPELPEAVISRVLARRSNQVVFEPFGCTGPASIAAIKNGWRWLYCELDPTNYELGKRRIASAIDAHGS